jgi:chitinase
MKNKTAFFLKLGICLILLTTINQLFAQKIVGYMPSWSGSASSIQYSKLTHINYAFVVPTTTGGLSAVEDAAKLQQIVTSGHAAGVKVLIAVGGWNNGDDSGFETLAGNSTYRTNFVNNVVNLVTSYNLDGVDVDWEYPDNSANFNSLMSALSTAMKSRGKLLTAAVAAVNQPNISTTIFGYVDFLNIMAYDGDGGAGHSPYSYAVTALNYWRGRGLAQAKAILGVPFYARPSWNSYSTLLSQGASAYSDYFNGDYYNGITTIQQKCALAKSQGGGIMIWELSQDATGANSLLSTIYTAIIGGGGGTPTGAPVGKTIWLRGNNGLYVSSNNGTSAMTCDRASAQGWEKFDVIDAGSGKIALKGTNGMYVSSENGAATGMFCNRATFQGWETFTWVSIGTTQVQLKGSNNLFVCQWANNGSGPVACNRAAASGWETFTWAVTTKSATIETEVISESENKIEIYPTVVTDQLNIKNNNSKTQIVVFDPSGRCVINKLLEVGENSINVSNLNSGMYIIKTTNQNHSQTNMFMKR